MLFSVILTNYNYSAFLSKAIESVLNQTYQNFELIIVDDGSSDNSRNIISSYAQRYPDKIKIIFKENQGQANAFNTAFYFSKGDIIVFLDSDDYFLPKKLEILKSYFEQGYDYILNDFIIEQTCSNSAIRYYPAYYPYAGYNLFLVCYLQIYSGHTTSNISISRRLADVIFPIEYEGEYKICADEWVVFSASILKEAFFLPQKLSVYRLHGTNRFMCSSPEERLKENKKNYEKRLLTSQVISKFLKIRNLDPCFLKNPYNLYAEFKTHVFIDNSLLKVYKFILNNLMDVDTKEKKRITKLMELYYQQYVNPIEKDKVTVLDSFVEGLNASENL